MSGRLLDSVAKQRIVTCLVALAGAAGAWLIALPLPLLLGPMLACLLAAFARLPLRDTGSLAVFMRTFLGIAVGTAITPSLLQQLPSMIPSLLLVPVFIAVIAVIGYPLLRRVFHFDHATAWYSAMPGGLQDMLVFGQEAGGDVRALSLIHATRVLVIVTIAPIILVHVWQVDLSSAPGAKASTIPWQQLALMVASGYAGWKIAARFNLFGAAILGPMLLSAALTLAGIIEFRPPAEMILAAQFFIGMSLGTQYVGITLRELRIDVTAGLVFSVLLTLVSIVFYFLVLSFTPAPALDVFISFLPGGQGEMVVIAIIAGADLAFVVSHHLLRIVIVITLAPLAAMLFKHR